LFLGFLTICIFPDCALRPHPHIPESNLVIVAATCDLIDILEIDDTQDDITDEPRRPLSDKVDVLLLLPVSLTLLIFSFILIFEHLPFTPFIRKQNVKVPRKEGSVNTCTE
jgi:hypothetical protein